MNKKYTYLSVAFAALSMSLAPAKASLISKESFLNDGVVGSYKDGAFTNPTSNEQVVVGNFGFSIENGWKNGTGLITPVKTAALTHSHLVAPSLPGGIRVDLNTSAVPRNSYRQLASVPPLSSSYYMSGLIRAESKFQYDGEFVSAGFGGTPPNWDTTDVSSGIHYGLSRSDGKDYLSVFAGGNTYNLLDVTNHTPETYQIVVSLVVDELGNERLWAGYAPSASESLTIVLAGVSVETWTSPSSLGYMIIQTATMGAHPARLSVLFDEIYLGTDLSDVTTYPMIPESSAAYSVAALAAFFLALYARKS